MPRFFAILFTVCYLLFAVPQAQGFVGPGAQVPGSGGGMFSVDPNRNIGFGTQGVVGTTTHATPPYSDPYGMGKIFMIASTSTPPGIGLRNLGQNLSGYDQNTYSIRPATYLLRLTPWGGFTIFDASETTYYSSSISRYRFTIHPNGGVTIGSDINTMDAPPPPPTGETAGKLEVFGSIKSIGGSFIGTLSGSLSAANVTGPSAFGTNYGTYNYAFPGALAIGTSTTAGLPTEGLYVKGNVGIGLPAPDSRLHVRGGNFKVDDASNNAALFVQQSSGNVGLGTTGPGYKLEVAGGATDDVLKITSTRNVVNPAMFYIQHNRGIANVANNDINQLVFTQDSNAAANAITTSIQSVTEDITSAAGGGLAFSTGGIGTAKERLRITKSGNVGIGTTGPGYLLHIAKSGTGGGLAIERTDGSASLGTILNSGGQIVFDYNGGSGYAFKQSGTEQVRINSGLAVGSTYVGTAPPAGGAIISGNVGIGTTTPASPLTVVGAIRSTTGGFIFPDATTQTTAATAGVNYWALSSASLYPTSTAYNVGVGTASLDANYKITTSGGGIKAESTSQPAGYFSSASGYGLIVNAGNVGIGTTGPITPLEVAKSTGGDLLRLSSGTSGDVTMVFTPAGASSNAARITGTTVSTNAELAFLTGGSERVRLDRSGNVGIGTTGPGYKLDVLGGATGVQLRLAAAAGYGTGIEFTDGTAGAEARNWRIGTANSVAGDFAILRSSAAGVGASIPTVTILNSGNVGIGTTDMTGKLTVFAGNVNNLGVKADVALSIQGGGYVNNVQQIGFGYYAVTNVPAVIGHIVTDASGSTKGALVFATRDVTTDTAPSERMRIDSAGNVGIGTTTPASPLTVVGAIRSTTGGFIFPDGTTQTTAGGGGTNFWTLSGTSLYPTSTAYNVGVGTASLDANYKITTSGGGIKAESTSQPAGYFSSASGYGLIVNSGNVGIGTTGPGQKLDLVGAFMSADNKTAATAKQAIFLAHQYDSAVETEGFMMMETYADSSVNRIDIGGGHSAYNAATAITFNTAANNATRTGTERMRIQSDGNVGIGTTTPAYKLTVVGTSQFSQPAFVGTPTSDSHAATKSYVDSAVVAGGDGSFTTITVSGTSTLSGNFSFGGAAITNLNMNSKDIVGVNKITVSTIDPLYEINGKKYATYVASIAGGVKEEYVGRAKLVKRDANIRMRANDTNEYEYTIDFDELNNGSALWVWYKTVDFSRDNVEVLATPKSVPAAMAYEISGNKITFRADILNTKYSIPDTGIDFSYRLIGKRFDWRKHPTRVESDETPSFIIP